MANGPSVPSLPESSACSEIRIANTMSELARVAELVDAFGADHKLPNSVIVALNVSLDEILNNIISYGYDDPEGVTADRLRTAITRACRDAGVARFSPHDLRHPVRSGKSASRHDKVVEERALSTRRCPLSTHIYAHSSLRGVCTRG